MYEYSASTSCVAVEIKAQQSKVLLIIWIGIYTMIQYIHM